MLLVGGRRPVLLSSHPARDDNAKLTCGLATSDLCADGRGDGQPALHERLSVHSFAQHPVQVRIELHFAADFADLFEARDLVRPSHGPHRPSDCGPDSVTLAYVHENEGVACPRHQAGRISN